MCRTNWFAGAVVLAKPVSYGVRYTPRSTTSSEPVTAPKLAVHTPTPRLRDEQAQILVGRRGAHLPRQVTAVLGRRKIRPFQVHTQNRRAAGALALHVCDHAQRAQQLVGRRGGGRGQQAGRSAGGVK